MPKRKYGKSFGAPKATYSRPKAQRVKPGRITDNKTKTNGMSYKEMVAKAIDNTTLKREHVKPITTETTVFEDKLKAAVKEYYK